MIVERPIGVCGSIVPWNFPVSLMGNKLGPALLTGNTVVVKPAGTTPLTDIQAWRSSKGDPSGGGPKGVLNIVPAPAAWSAKSCS